MPAEPPEELVDRLYGLDPAEFTPARDEAAKALRKEKRRDEAKAVAALRKPSAAAWLVNRLRREHPEAVDALIEAGDALRDAQDRAVAGEGAGELRAATEAERRAVDALVREARELRPGGRAPSEATLEQARTTLHAAAADPAVREDVAAGRVVREVQGGGAWPFADAGDEAAPAPAPPAAEPAPRRRRPSRKADPEERERERAEEKRRKEAERAEEARRKEEEQSRRRELAAARKARDARRRERERAERRVQEAEDRAAEAAEAARRAAGELDEARAAEEEADRALASLGD
jgi:hypothetical protein